MEKYHHNFNTPVAYFRIMQLYKLNIETNLNYYGDVFTFSQKMTARHFTNHKFKQHTFLLTTKPIETATKGNLKKKNTYKFTRIGLIFNKRVFSMI